MKLTNNCRESNFELLRLVVMLFIVVYHFLIHVNSHNGDHIFYKSLYLTLHIAVPCFVLISGYFHIKPTIRGGCKLFLPVILYCTLPYIIWAFINNDWNHYEYILFLSSSNYWFVRDYFYLFLISPLLNWFLENKGERDRIYLIIVLSFISVYMSYRGDSSVDNGKNVALFMLLYGLGDYIHFCKMRIGKIKYSKLLLFWIVLNLFLVLAYIFYSRLIFGKVIWHLSFEYKSPVLLINAILFFIIFSRLKFSSRWVNKIAGSAYAIFVIEASPVLREVLIYRPLSVFCNYESSSLLLLLLVIAYAIFICFVCVIIDQLLKPLQTRILNIFTSNQI